jgi:hypothetical protein
MSDMEIMRERLKAGDDDSDDDDSDDHDHDHDNKYV